jgi:hypothetical protein
MIFCLFALASHGRFPVSALILYTSVVPWLRRVPSTAEARFRPRGIRGGQSVSGTVIFQSSSVLPCHYFTGAPYSYISCGG